MGTLTISRTNQFVNRIRKIQIYVDDSKFYKIANGESKSFELPDGVHQVYVKIDWIKSRITTVLVEGSKEKLIELGSPIKSNYNKVFGSPSLSIIIILAFLSRKYHNDLIMLIPVSIMLIVKVYFLFFSENKSALYYMFVKPRDLFYLKEV